MAAEIARELLGDDCPPTYETFLGPPAERMEALSGTEPGLDGRRILFMSSGPGEFRMFYKGLDLMVEAVAKALDRDPSIEFDILGTWDEEIVERCLAPVPEAGFIQPHAQYERPANGDPNGGLASTGPVTSREFKELTMLFSDLDSGILYGTTADLEAIDGPAVAAKVRSATGSRRPPSAG